MRNVRFAAVAIVLCLLAPEFVSSATRIEISPSGTGTCGHATVEIWIESDVDISRISLPLILRSGTEGVRYGDIQFAGPLGRGTGKLSGFQYFQSEPAPSELDDPVVITCESFSLGADCFPAGMSEKIFELTVPVRLGGGNVVIDTMYSPPCSGVELIRCVDGQPLALDEFVPGYIEVFGVGAPFPSVEDNPVVGYAGTSLQNQIVANDPGGGPVRYGLVQGPGVVDSLTGVWSWDTCVRDTGFVEVRAFAHNQPSECEPVGPSVVFGVDVLPPILGDHNCDGASDAVDLNLLIDHLFFGISLIPCE